MNGKVKVVHFLNSLVRGGVEQHVLLLVAHLDREQFDPVIVCPPALADLLRPDLNGSDVRVVPLKIRSIFDIRDMARFVAFLRREKVDIVHAHLFNASRVSHFLAKLAGVGITIETNHVREGWRKGILKTWYAIDRFFGRFTDTVIAVSRANAEYLSKVKGIEKKKIKVVSNGIETRAFDSPNGRAGSSVRSRLGIGPDVPLVTVIARLEPQKGHVYLLEAIPDIIRKHPETVFLLAGDGALKDELEATAAGLGIEKNVVFAGFRRDVAALLKASTVFVLPSLWEGLPLVAVEASAAGVPVVATAVDGTPEVIKDGETGLLVPPKDPQALARAIISLLDEPETARNMGQNGAMFVRNNFDIERQVKETELIYKSSMETLINSSLQAAKRRSNL